MTKGVFVAAVASSVFVADQATKLVIRRTVPLYHSIPVVDSLFDITHAQNSGGAFSLFAGAPDAVRIPFFLVAASLAIGVLLYFLRSVRPEQRLLQFALAGILGGALGNLFDRMTSGRVTDFLDVYWGNHHWPAFNVADSFISIGVVVLLAHSLIGDRDSEPKTSPKTT